MKYRYVAVAAAATGASAQAQYETPPAYIPPAVSTPISILPISSSSNVPVISASSAPISSMSSAPIVPISSAPVSYTTVTFDDCESASIETLITVTNGVTVTYCPTCEHESTSAAPKPTGPAHTTVYTTVYSSLCSTGLVPVTYTVTESCSDATPTWASATDHVPEGFTVTTKDCHVCDETPVPVTITEPCTDGCGKPAPPPATPTPAPSGKPVEQIPDGQIQAPGPSGKPVSQIPDGQVQAPGPSGGSPAPTGGAQRPPADASCPGGANCPAGGDAPAPAGDDSKCPGGTNCPKPAPGASASNSGAGPYPTPSGKCPGPDCEAKPTGNVTKPGNEGPEQYTGGASAISIGFASMFVTVVAGFAFLL